MEQFRIRTYAEFKTLELKQQQKKDSAFKDILNPSDTKTNSHARIRLPIYRGHVNDL